MTRLLTRLVCWLAGHDPVLYGDAIVCRSCDETLNEPVVSPCPECGHPESIRDGHYMVCDWCAAKRLP